MQRKQRLYQVVVSAICVALAFVARQYFSIMISLFGGSGMRISLAGIFTSIPALLFGPITGGIVGGLVDLIAYVLKPEGPFIPWFTLTAVLAGVLKGLIWKYAKNVKTSVFKKVFLSVTIIFIVLGIANHVIDVFFPNVAWANFLNSFGKKKVFIVVGIDIIGVVGLVFYLVNMLISKYSKNDNVNNNFLKLTITLGIAGIIVTTINTHVLKAYIPGLANVAFIILYIPRLVEEVLISILNAYVISLLLKVFDRMVIINKPHHPGLEDVEDVNEK